MKYQSIDILSLISILDHKVVVSVVSDRMPNKKYKIDLKWS